MKKLVTIITVLLSTVVLVNCTSKKATTSNKSPEEKIAEVKKMYSEADIAEGKQLFKDNCNKCHPYKEPETRTVEKWDRVLPRMTKRADLNDEQSAKVRAYILTNVNA